LRHLRFAGRGDGDARSCGEHSAQGFMLGKAVDGPPRTIVLIGAWIMFLPSLIVSVGVDIYLIVNFRGLGNFVFFWLGVGLTFISGMILYRVTKTFISRRRGNLRH
jgi:hypothetical protein